MSFLPVSEISYGNFVPSKEMSKKRKRPESDQEIKGDASFSWGWRVQTSSILELNLKQINKIIWKRPRSNRVGKVDDDGYKATRVRPSCCTSVFPETSNIGNKDHNLDRAKEFCDKAMKETSSQDYLKLLKWLDDYGTGKISMVDVKIMIADYFPSFMDDFDRLVKFYGYKKRLEEEEERLTENYYFLPKGVRGVHNPDATMLEKQVINRWCFCKGSYGVGAPKTISPAEKRLNQREDELFRMDMLKEWNRKNSTKPGNTRLFPEQRSGSVKSDPPLVEPFSPKVSCMGRVRSRRDRNRSLPR